MRDAPDIKPRSRDVTDGMERAAARGMLRAVGMSDDDFAKPQIGVASSWNEITPCNLSLDRLAKAAKDGVHAAGGFPLEFGTISVSDGISMGHEGMHYSLVSREVIADSVEVVMQAERLDGFVEREHEFLSLGRADTGQLQRGGHAILVPSFPAVTCPVQANMTTGLPPREHGVVANNVQIRWLVPLHAEAILDAFELEPALPARRPGHDEQRQKCKPSTSHVPPCCPRPQIGSLCGRLAAKSSIGGDRAA